MPAELTNVAGVWGSALPPRRQSLMLSAWASGDGDKAGRQRSPHSPRGRTPGLPISSS